MSEKKEYIERQAIRDAIATDGYEHFSKNLTSTEISLLEMVDYNICEAPAADVAEVVHGKWIEEQRFVNKADYACSVCGADYSITDIEFKNWYNYCPNCCAKMDKKKG